MRQPADSVEGYFVKEVRATIQDRMQGSSSSCV